MIKENYYDILGIPSTNEQSIIKQAYKKQIILFHPDKNKDKNATNTFLKIKKAYEILSNPITKEEFDNKLTFYNDKKKYAAQRKTMLEELISREKEAKKKDNKNECLQKKREREYKDFEYISNNYIQNKKKFCLKISYKDSIEFEFNKEIVKEYFSDFGIIDEIIMNKEENYSFLTYKYESLLDNSIEKIKQDKKINNLFNIEKFLYKNINSFNNTQNPNSFDINNQINTQKILNSLDSNKKFDFDNISLENFEKEIFK